MTLACFLLLHDVCIVFFQQISKSTIGDASRDRTKDFTYDYSYWSVDPANKKFASQEQVGIVG